jgi:hypothetical protein
MQDLAQSGWNREEATGFTAGLHPYATRFNITGSPDELCLAAPWWISLTLIALIWIMLGMELLTRKLCDDSPGKTWRTDG